MLFHFDIIPAATKTMKVALHRIAATAMTTLTTGVQYLGSNDASYDDPIIDSSLTKNGFHFEKLTLPQSTFCWPMGPLWKAKGLHTVGEPCGQHGVFHDPDSGSAACNRHPRTHLRTFTVLENLMVLCVILHSQTLRSLPSYHFIGSLAVADLIGSIIFVYSFLDFHVLHRKDSPNIFLFKLAGVIGSFTASVGSLPMAYKRIVTKTKAVIAFSLMWTISIVISLLPLLGWNCKRLNSVCSDIFPLIDQKYLMFWIGMTSILVLFIIYAYMFILWKSHNHAVRMLSRSSQRSVIVYTAEGTKVQTVRPEQARMDLRLAKTLVLILVALIICWGPLLTIMVYDLFGKVNDFIKTIFAFCSMLTLLNSTVNPVIYAMRSKDLRRAFLNLCHMCRGMTQPLDNSGESDWNIRSVRGTASGAGKDGAGSRKTRMKVAQVTVSGVTETSTAEPV
uniref:Cannabinoid receptor 1 n=1 Tax=Sphaeramia orbicularis TaxID=375764 RepID=A0A673CUH8_9TELE